MQGIQDTFPLVLFYTFYFFLLCIFILHWFPDLKAIQPAGGYEALQNDRAVYTEHITDDEKTPLLFGNQRDTGSHTSYGHAVFRAGASAEAESKVCQSQVLLYS